MLEIAEWLGVLHGGEENPERFPLSNYIPKHILQSLQESLSKALGIPLLFSTWDGMPITRSEMLDTFCCRFTHNSRISRPCMRCMRFSDIDVIGSDVGMARITQMNDCPFGFNDVVVPIVLGSRISAFLLTSQTTNGKSSREHALKSLQDAGFHKQSASHYLSRIPCVEIEHLKKIEEALTSISEIVAATAMSYAANTRLAIRDPLTGLPNRAHMWSYLKSKVDATKFNPEPFSVISLKTIDMRSINENHGHKAGDEVIKTVAQILETSIRPYDLAVRYDGDEFVVILDNVGRRLAKRVADRILRRIENAEIKYGRVIIKTGAHIGITSYTKNCGRTAEDVFKKVDSNLFRIKSYERK